MPDSSTKPLPPRHSSASAACGGGALAHPVLHHRGGEAPECRLRRLVVGARHPQRRDRGRLGLDRQVGQHVAHRRLLDERRAERRAVAGVVDRLERAAAHARGRAEQAVEPRVVDHPDDRRHAAALLADQPAAGAAELDLRGRQRARPELVLEALELHPRPALHQEAGQAGGRLREHQEDVARRIGAEPLVAVELVPPSPTGSARVMLARTSEPPWRSVIAMPGQRPALVVGRVSRGSHSAASSGAPSRSAGIAA